eukprot:15480266-Alexandrium_andersonii.AAC.1
MRMRRTRRRRTRRSERSRRTSATGARCAHTQALAGHDSHDRLPCGLLIAIAIIAIAIRIILSYHNRRRHHPIIVAQQLAGVCGGGHGAGGGRFVLGWGGGPGLVDNSGCLCWWIGAGAC